MDLLGAVNTVFGYNFDEEKFFSLLENMGLNLNESKDIIKNQNNLLILSGAGAGKTTSMVLKIIYDLASPHGRKKVKIQTPMGVNEVEVQKDVLVTTFSRTGAEELEYTFKSWVSKLGVSNIDVNKVKFSTIHAEVKSALQDMGVHVDIIDSNMSILEGFAKKYGIQNVKSYSKKLGVQELRDLETLLSYVRNRLDDKKYSHDLMKDYNLNVLVVQALLEDMKNYRKAIGKLDFEDMQEMLLEGILVNPHVEDFISNRYDMIYVDEFQDTSQLQYAILKTYFKNAKVVVIGDDDQTIYSWRGSDINIITHRFKEDFQADTLYLTTNYRCKSNILKAVVPSISRNKKRNYKDLKSYHEGGEVKVVNNIDINDFIRMVKQDIKNGKTVGVLSRVNEDLIMPYLLLELDDTISFEVTNTLTLNSYLTMNILGLIELFTKRYTPSFETYLRLIFSKKSAYEIKNVCDILNTNVGYSLWDLPLEDLRKSAPNMFPLLEKFRMFVKYNKKKAYIWLLMYLKEQVFVSNSKYAVRGREIVSALIDIVRFHEKVKDKTLEGIDDLFNNVLPSKLHQRKKYGKGVLRLTTVHESKGKEWDCVYIWNDIVNTFPYEFSDRILTDDEFEEERRLHYIAWTRAKEKLVVLTKAGQWGAFLKECDLSHAEILGEGIKTRERLL